LVKHFSLYASGADASWITFEAIFTGKSIRHYQLASVTKEKLDNSKPRGWHRRRYFHFVRISSRLNVALLK
jgi:hypothetical protein